LPTTELQRPAVRDQHQVKSLLLVLFCTFVNAASQVFIKLGTASLGPHPKMIETAIGILTRPMLFSGYALLGISTILFVLALRRGELSLLYPVLTLGYVWVTILSVVVFKDSMNLFKIAGVTVIMVGVGVLGKASNQ
jgi:multidrug transporter EmrE-like cation transporter